MSSFIHDDLLLETEVARKKRGEASEIMDALIGYHWEEFLGPFGSDPAEIDWRTE